MTYNLIGFLRSGDFLFSMGVRGWQVLENGMDGSGH